jgi:hypothetical protein
MGGSWLEWIAQHIMHADYGLIDYRLFDNVAISVQMGDRRSAKGNATQMISERFYFRFAFFQLCIRPLIPNLSPSLATLENWLIEA